MFDWIIIRICNDGSLIARFSYRQQKIIMRIREVVMKLTEFLREELDREVERSRKALEQVPNGKYDWKPHERSMIFGYLADMVATIPMWIQMEIERDELDVAPPEGQGLKQTKKESSEALIQALDETAAAARTALEKTTDEHLR